jgi:hypothetical protein
MGYGVESLWHIVARSKVGNIGYHIHQYCYLEDTEVIVELNEGDVLFLSHSRCLLSNMYRASMLYVPDELLLPPMSTRQQIGHRLSAHRTPYKDL